MIEWPARIKRNVQTWTPAGSYDVLPTILDLLGTRHPHPDHRLDGVSLLPLLSGEVPPDAPRRASRPLCFLLPPQAACIDNDLKVVSDPGRGGCEWNDYNVKKQMQWAPPYHLPHAATNVFLFNLSADPTESSPLNAKHPELLAIHAERLRAWRDGVRRSQLHETLCALPEPPRPPPWPPGLAPSTSTSPLSSPPPLPRPHHHPRRPPSSGKWTLRPPPQCPPPPWPLHASPQDGERVTATSAGPPPTPAPCFVVGGAQEGRINAFLLRKNCGSFKNRAECDKHFFFDARPDGVGFGASAAAGTPAKSGSCSWDLKIKRCVTLPPHKEPCLVFGNGQAGVTKNTSSLAKLVREGMTDG